MGREERSSQPPAAQPEGRAIIARLADDLLPVLIARLEASALGELEVRENGWRVRLRRPVQPNGSATSDEPLLSLRPADGVRQAGQPAGAPTDSRSSGSRERQRTHIESPAVGYFLPRDSLAAGASLRNGDVVGHIDVLGVRQEVVSPADGILARLEAEPGQAVEYGQAIARLEPDSREIRG
ncbi:acetyl-CoA carboxylase biotin carboxyl carrier protein [soil metagenome]